jgi:hypothetical protein
MGEMGAQLPLRHNQHVPRQSIQTPNVNSSSLKDIFDVVAMVFQQIMAELNGADSDKDRIVAITKIVLKHMKRYCHVQLTMTVTKDKPTLLSEREPQIDKMTTA